VKIWDPDTGEELPPARPFMVTVARGIAWSPDGQLLAGANEGFLVTVWDDIVKGVWFTFNGHTGGVNTVSWSTDGKQLVSGSRGDWTVRVWDLPAKKPLRVFRGHSAPVRCVAWRPRSTQIASCSEDGTIIIWDMGTDNPPFPLGAPGEGTWLPAWSPDGQRLATVGGDKINIWDADTRRVIRTFSAAAPGKEIRLIEWSLDGASLVTAIGWSTIVWDAASGKQRAVYQHNLESHVTLSPNGKQIFMGQAICRLDTGEPILQLSGESAAAFSPDGLRLATGDWGGNVMLWDAATGKLLHKVRAHVSGVRHLTWRHDGSQLASCGDDGFVRVWDPSTGTTVVILRGHTGPVRHVAWSPDDRRLASASDDWTVRIWDPAQGTEMLKVHKYNNWATTVAWHPDGKRLASAMLRGRTLIHDARPLQEQK